MDANLARYLTVPQNSSRNARVEGSPDDGRGTGGRWQTRGDLVSRPYMQINRRQRRAFDSTMRQARLKINRHLSARSLTAEAAPLGYRQSRARPFPGGEPISWAGQAARLCPASGRGRPDVRGRSTRTAGALDKAAGVRHCADRNVALDLDADGVSHTVQRRVRPMPRGSTVPAAAAAKTSSSNEGLPSGDPAQNQSSV